MRAKLLVACLASLGLCGLAFAQKGAAGSTGSNPGASTWTSAIEIVHVPSVVRFSSSNAPGKCLAALVVGLCDLNGNPVPPTPIPRVCLPASSSRCLGGVSVGRSATGATIVTSWCGQRG